MRKRRWVILGAAAVFVGIWLWNLYEYQTMEPVTLIEADSHQLSVETQTGERRVIKTPLGLTGLLIKGERYYVTYKHRLFEADHLVAIAPELPASGKLREE